MAAFVSYLPHNLFQGGPLITSRCQSRSVAGPRQVSVCQIKPSKPKSPHRISQARYPRELHLCYAVWNTVMADEGLPPLGPDEVDAESCTVHLLVRSSKRHVVGAARLLSVSHNARLDRVAVLPQWRGKGVGRALVERLLVLTASIQGAVYVNATRGEMGFFSILGFEAIGNDFIEGMMQMRTMMYRTPMCTPSVGCVGLHHTSVVVSDIEKSLAFYGSLGFFVTDKFVTSGGQRACYVEGLGTRLEFVEAKGVAGGLSGVQGVPSTGFDRLVFDVTKACTDLEKFIQHLERRNGGVLNIAGRPAQQVSGSSVVSVASIFDPDSLPIDFIRREARVPSELRTRVDW